MGNGALAPCPRCPPYSSLALRPGRRRYCYLRRELLLFSNSRGPCKRITGSHVLQRDGTVGRTGSCLTAVRVTVVAALGAAAARRIFSRMPSTHGRSLNC